MDDLDNKNITSFHIQLLAETIDIHQYPLIKLMIEQNVTQAEHDDLFCLLHKLNELYEIQKEEGFLDFTSLLVHFAGMLTEKLDPNQTIYALKKEGYYPSLMTVFIQLIENGACY